MVKPFLAVALFSLMFNAAAQAVAVKVTIKGSTLSNQNFAELKVESDQKGAQATHHVTENGEKTFEWDMGASNQNIFFWWDNLAGSAHLTVSVDGTVVFDGDCSHADNGEISVKETCGHPTVYKTAGSPRLEEHKGKRSWVTWILF